MKIKPYTQWDYTPVPTPMTRFFRTCVLWQIVRFAVINLKMLVVVSKSH
ncbi:hypothetical protein [Nitrosophilus alvini]|nr:hypothetical protein [Nitrosophilus alvini]